MAKIPENVQELFKEVPNVIFATATAEAQPNMCVIGMKALIDEETVYLSDQYFKKTLANLKANEKVAVLILKGHDAYVIHGTARYVDEGPEFEEQKAWVDAAFEAKGFPVRAKGGCFVHADAVYTSHPGEHAGDQIS